MGILRPKVSTPEPPPQPTPEELAAEEAARQATTSAAANDLSASNAARVGILSLRRPGGRRGTGLRIS